jgi:hypothetical protein
LLNGANVIKIPSKPLPCTTQMKYVKGRDLYLKREREREREKGTSCTVTSNIFSPTTD